MLGSGSRDDDDDDDEEEGSMAAADPFGEEENSLVGHAVRRACISNPIIVW